MAAGLRSRFGSAVPNWSTSRTAVPVLPHLLIVDFSTIVHSYLTTFFALGRIRPDFSSENPEDIVVRPMQGKLKQVHIVPRSRDDRPLPPVVLSLKRIEEYFSLPLNEASKQLGVSASALKW